MMRIAKIAEDDGGVTEPAARSRRSAGTAGCGRSVIGRGGAEMGFAWFELPPVEGAGSEGERDAPSISSPGAALDVRRGIGGGGLIGGSEPAGGGTSIPASAPSIAGGGTSARDEYEMLGAIGAFNALARS